MSLHLLCNVLRGQHSGVRRSLVSVRLDLHASSDAADRLPTGKVSHVDEGIVEGSEDVGDAEDKLAIADLRPERHLHLLLSFLLSLARSHGRRLQIRSLVEVNQAIK